MVLGQVRVESLFAVNSFRVFLCIEVDIKAAAGDCGLVFFRDAAKHPTESFALGFCIRA